MIPASDYSSAKPTLTEPPIVITTTIPGLAGHRTVLNGSVTTTVPWVATITNSAIYCPAPYVFYAGGCYMGAVLTSLMAAQSTGTLFIIEPQNVSTAAAASTRSSSRVSPVLATTTGMMASASTSVAAAASTVAPNPGNAAGRVAVGNSIAMAVGLMGVAFGMVLVL